MAAEASVVRIRLSGPPAAVERVSEWLCHGLQVEEVSLDYPNHRDPGVRRYLTVAVLAAGHGRGERS
jgi:hypothetical protein